MNHRNPTSQDRKPGSSDPTTVVAELGQIWVHGCGAVNRKPGRTCRKHACRRPR